MAPWWHAVVEARHELQNPTSHDKLRLLGARLGLSAASHVLDMASGRAGPAVLLAQEFGCRVTCVERAAEFVTEAERRVDAAGLRDRVELVQADARDFPLEPERYDAALCLGASFVWGGLTETVAALAPAVGRRGFVVVGEPYWRRWPLPTDVDLEEAWDFAPLPETFARFESAGVPVVGVIASTEDDWDRYETLHWQTLEEWLHEHPDHPDAAEFRQRGARERERYLRWQRDLLGWAIFLGRKR